MKLAICDDEKSLRRQLKHLAKIHLALKGIACEITEYESGNALLQKVNDNPPDLLFLDIEMPGMGGMDTAKALRLAGFKMLIIFITAYPDYVFEGYEVQAFQYILKPYQETKIKQILDRAIDELHTHAAQYFLIEQKSGTLRIPFHEICYFKSDRRTIHAKIQDGSTVSFYRKLGEVEAELPGFFQRIHNRYIVNLHYISRVEAAKCICNEKELPVSRTYKLALASSFAQMILK
ncbi:MAG: LytTR family DNA-binding domain-containing protein [Eubacterium sp.]|nr:LytTR family DNA-binding domain-containing protein [Eubacterium sp.]